jgi:hypothetical protein
VAYGKPDVYALWLINIQYNLDLIWLDENGHVVYAKENAQICTNPFDASKCTYKNTSPAKYVIAASSGFIANHNVSTSSTMKVISIWYNKPSIVWICEYFDFKSIGILVEPYFVRFESKDLSDLVKEIICQTI